MPRKSRKSYTIEQRKKILEAATSSNLTAFEVQKKFGVTPVTYYSWRKKAGLKGPRGRKPGKGSMKATLGTQAITSQMRAEVKAKVMELMPMIVRSEVNAYLDSLFSRSGRKARAEAK